MTSKRVDEVVAEIAWLGGDRKGAYILLGNSARQQLRALAVDVDDQPIAEEFQERLASTLTVWRYVEDPACCQRP